MSDDFGDPLVTGVEPGMPERFFDRFMLNGHPVDGRGPSFVIGAGLYPPRNVIDGFAVVVLPGAGSGAGPGEQRNARFSTELSATRPDHVGPLRWEVPTPMERWRVRFDDPAIGVALDAEWTARAPAWSGTVTVENAAAEPTRFDHLFQSGTLAGTLTVDGETVPVDGWYSQRDRSRGVRHMAGGQGLHVWFQAQFPELCVGFLLVESRTGERLQLEGAAMHTDGRLDPIVDVAHALRFRDGLDLDGGTVRVTCASGERFDIEADASDRGGYMAGGGYGGHHGRALGVDHAGHDGYPLDGSVTPASLDTPLTDRLTRFRLGAVEGSGIFEFAHSRSASYRYTPSLPAGG